MGLWMPSWAWLLVRRHLFGRKARAAVLVLNLFAVGSVALGVAAWSSVVSIMDGLQGEIREGILKEKPHLLWEGRPQAGLPAIEGAPKAGPGQMEAKIRQALGSEVKAINFLLQTEALLEVRNGDQRGRITGAGVVLQGIPNFGPAIRGGIELMSLVGIAPGDPIRLHSVWKMELAPLDIAINEAFESGVYEVDKGYIRMDRSRLQEWMELPGAVSRIEIKLNRPDRAEELLPKLVQAGFTGDIRFKSWRETESSLWYSLKLEKIVLSIAMFFVVLIASIAVHLALSVRVAEKTREIGLMRGLGADDRMLSRIYLTEGAILGVAGAVIGLICGYAACMLISNFWQVPSFYYSTKVPVIWSWGLNSALAGGAVVLAVLASWLPARKVKLIEVQEALRS